jgi:hypothetical protein
MNGVSSKLFKESAMHPIRFVLAAGVVLCSLLAAFGAPPADPEPTDARVNGAVTVAGQPLAEGRIFFHLDGGQFVGCKVKAGKYRIDRVPLGEHRVTFEGNGVAAKYASEEATGLVTNVTGAANTFDFELQ